MQFMQSIWLQCPLAFDTTNPSIICLESQFDFQIFHLVVMPFFPLSQPY